MLQEAWHTSESHTPCNVLGPSTTCLASFVTVTTQLLGFLNTGENMGHYSIHIDWTTGTGEIVN